MLKWILGGCATLILIACIFAWIGYRKLKTYANEGPAATVTIMASPHRVFASLADPDSMADWRMDGAQMTAAHKGLLKAGDTLVVRNATQSSTGRPARLNWVVTVVTMDQLVAFEAVDTAGHAMMTRRDSVIGVGDSTRVISTIAAPMMDSIQARSGKSGPVAQGVMGMASTAMIAALRMSSDMELKRLKIMIEGHPIRDSVPR
jgi:uncharacterized protein YndB with AHSA1/START domain